MSKAKKPSGIDPELKKSFAEHLKELVLSIASGFSKILALIGVVWATIWANAQFFGSATLTTLAELPLPIAIAAIVAVAWTGNSAIVKVLNCFFNRRR